MAANNIGVPKRIPAPNTIERVGIGNGGSDPSAPKPKQASPAFTFGGAGSGTAFHIGPWVMHRPCTGRCMHAHASCARRQGTRAQKSQDQVSRLPGLHGGPIASAIGLRVRATCAARSALPVGGGGCPPLGSVQPSSLVVLVCAKPARRAPPPLLPALAGSQGLSQLEVSFAMLRVPL